MKTNLGLPKNIIDLFNKFKKTKLNKKSKKVTKNKVGRFFG